MCTTILEASYAHCMKTTASLTSLNVFGMEMMGKLNDTVLCVVEQLYSTLINQFVHVIGLAKIKAIHLNMVTTLMQTNFYGLLVARLTGLRCMHSSLKISNLLIDQQCDGIHCNHLQYLSWYQTLGYVISQ